MFASSCSLYDGLAPGIHDEDAPIKPRAAYATSKRYGEESLIRQAGEGLCPVMLRNGTVYGWSPRMRFDLVVNTFVKDALLEGHLKLHGGGWMWRPLVDVCDCAEAMIAAYEAPAEKVRGEIFNVVHSNYQIRELAMIVAGSVQLTGRQRLARGGPRTGAEPRLRVRQRQALDDAGLHPPPLGARGGQRSARADRLDVDRVTPHRSALLQHPLAGTPQRGQAGPRLIPRRPVRALITGGGGQLASDLAELLEDDARAFTHEELDICDEGALERAYREVQPDLVINCAAFHNLDACEREPARAWAVNVEAVRGAGAAGRAA